MHADPGTRFSCGIRLVDHVLELSLGRVLAEGPHHGAELLGGDGTIAVLVEEGESLAISGSSPHTSHTSLSNRVMLGRLIKPPCIFDFVPAVSRSWTSSGLLELGDLLLSQLVLGRIRCGNWQALKAMKMDRSCSLSMLCPPFLRRPRSQAEAVAAMLDFQGQRSVKSFGCSGTFEQHADKGPVLLLCRFTAATTSQKLAPPV